MTRATSGRKPRVARIIISHQHRGRAQQILISDQNRNKSNLKRAQTGAEGVRWRGGKFNQISPSCQGSWRLIGGGRAHARTRSRQTVVRPMSSCLFVRRRARAHQLDETRAQIKLHYVTLVIKLINLPLGSNPLWPTSTSDWTRLLLARARIHFGLRARR